MELWLDTADEGLIKEAKGMGILRGVTTNPEIIAKTGQPTEALIERLLVIQPGPVTAQVIEETAEEMIEEGRNLYDISDRVIVKVPVTKAGIRAISVLSHAGISCMGTIIFTPMQAFLAASAGADYTAAYFSKIDEAGMNARDTLANMQKTLIMNSEGVKLLAASIHKLEQIEVCAELGIDAVTMGEDAYAQLVKDHPLTVDSLVRFQQAQ